MPRAHLLLAALEAAPPDGVTPFANVGEPIAVTNPMGYFVAPVSAPGPGFMRAVWTADTTIASQDTAIG